MNTQPAIELITILDCPYCPRTGAGVVAVDASKVFDRARNAERAHIKSASRDPVGIVVFNPDRPNAAPCPHLISGLFDVLIVRYMKSGAEKARFIYTFSFDVPWFESTDKGRSYGEFLWTEIDGGSKQHCHPLSPFQIRRIGEGLPIHGSKYDLEIRGTAFLAMTPSVFLEELAAGFERFQRP